MDFIKEKISIYNQFIIENKEIIKKLSFPLLIVIIYLLNFNVSTNFLCYAFPVFSALDNLYKKNLHNITLLILLFILLNFLDAIEEMMLAPLLRMVPLYYLIKLILICFLMFPNFKGFNLLYSNLFVYVLATNDDNYGCRHKIKEFIKNNENKYSSIYAKSDDNTLNKSN